MLLLLTFRGHTRSTLTVNVSTGNVSAAVWLCTYLRFQKPEFMFNGPHHVFGNRQLNVENQANVEVTAKKECILHIHVSLLLHGCRPGVVNH